MADALAKYRSALKRYRRENPNVPFKTAQQRVAAEMKSGKIAGAKKRKKVAAASQKKARADRPSQKKAIGTKSRMTRPPKVGKAKPKAIGRVEKGLALVSEIKRLEKKRAKLKERELRDIVQLEINRCHDKLDALTKAIKRKSA